MSNFQFLLKALRFPGTAPILLALSLTAFLAGQFNSLLSSQAALQPPVDDDEPDQSPESKPVSLPPITPEILPELLPPEQLLGGQLPGGQAEFPLDLSPPQIAPLDQSFVPENLGVTLPKPLPANPPSHRSVQPPQAVQVAPELVISAVSHTLAYQTLRSHTSLAETAVWTDLEKHWSRPYVEALSSLDLLHGSPDGNFEPDRPITRAELASLLQRSLPRPEAMQETIVLQDVPPTHWAASSIEQAVRMGFFPDAESTQFFNPDRPASRLVTWGAIVSGLDLPSSKQHNALLQAWEASRVPSPDVPSSAKTPQEELNQPVTRAEAVVLLYHALRLTEQGQNLAFIAPPTPITAQVSASVSPQSSAHIQGTPVLSPESVTPENVNLESVNPETHSQSDRVAASQTPILVAAQLPLPDPLLSPLPPISEEFEDTTPQKGLQSQGQLQPIERQPVERQPVERLSPEFAAEPILAQVSPDQDPLAQASPDQVPLNGSAEGTTLQTALSSPAAVDQTYRLGAGDRVFIEIFGLPQYSQEYQVLVDGSLNLPRAGRMVVDGMTLAEAESLIYGRYARYYQQPATSVVLVSPRSLRVAVTGAVNRPGVYRLSPDEGTAVLSVTQALQEAGGIDPDADLRQVKVYRSQRNGDPQELVLNLWNLLQNGDLDQDISLRDGDRLVIPQAESLSIEELNQIATANIAPNAIEVTVVGSAAESQGSLKLSPNTPLNQVVLAAGGFNDRRESRTVNLIRLHANGTVEQRLLDVPIAADVNETNNPILRDKDVIVLDRSKGSALREGTLGVLGNILRVIPFVNLLF